MAAQKPDKKACLQLVKVKTNHVTAAMLMIRTLSDVSVIDFCVAALV